MSAVSLSKNIGVDKLGRRKNNEAVLSYMPCWAYIYRYTTHFKVFDRDEIIWAQTN